MRMRASASSRKIGAASSPPSSSNISRAMSRSDSQRRWKRIWTPSPKARSPGARCYASSGPISRRQPARRRICASPKSSTCSTKHWARISSRRARTAPTPRQCPACEAGRLSLKLGKFGAFIGCSNYPECRHTQKLDAEITTGEDGESKPALSQPVDLGFDPTTGKAVSVRPGPYGPYVQMETDDKPKRQGLPRGLKLEDVTLEKALDLLRLPRLVGMHPDKGEKIEAGIGTVRALPQTRLRLHFPTQRRRRADGGHQPRRRHRRGRG